jgi:hypothetical protein
MDFVQDRTDDGRPLRMLVVLDELTAIRGAPAHIRADNGPEMISKAVKAWCEENGTGALSIDPGVTVAERHRRELQRPAAGRAPVV